MDKISRLLICCSLAGIPGVVLAENTDSVSVRIAAHTTHISGKLEAHRIPYFAKMNSFFLHYDRVWKSEVSKLLAEEDLRVLSRITAGLDAVQRKIVANMNRQEIAVCENLASLDAATLAPMADQIDKYYEDEISNHYRLSLRDLSTHGHSVITEFVDREVARRMSVAVTNRLSLYTEFPHLLMSQVQLKCSGDTQAIEAAMADLAKQLEAQGHVRSSSESGDVAFGGNPKRGESK